MSETSLDSPTSGFGTGYNSGNLENKHLEEQLKCCQFLIDYFSDKGWSGLSKVATPARTNMLPILVKLNILEVKGNVGDRTREGRRQWRIVDSLPENYIDDLTKYFKELNT